MSDQKLPQHQKGDDAFSNLINYAKQTKKKRKNITNEYLHDDSQRMGFADELLNVLEYMTSIFDFVGVIHHRLSQMTSTIMQTISRIMSKFTSTGQSYETSIISLLSNIITPIEYLMDQYNEFLYGPYEYDQRLLVTRLYHWLQRKIEQISIAIRKWIRRQVFGSDNDTREQNDSTNLLYPEDDKKEVSKKTETSTHRKSFSLHLLALSLLLLFWRILYLRWRLSPEVSRFDDPSLTTHVEQMYIDPITKRDRDHEVRRFYQNRHQNRSYAMPQLRQDFFSYFPRPQERRLDLVFRNNNPGVPRGIAPVVEDDYEPTYMGISPFNRLYDTTYGESSINEYLPRSY